jgi:SET domain-containing protein
MLYLSNSPAHGRGVFAGKRFAKGDLIENAPVLIIPPEQVTHLDETLLANYYYCWGEELEAAAVAMGFGSFYNHSYFPNAEFTQRFDTDVVEFIAIRTIEPGEEITVNYNGLPDDLAPVWFETK